MQRLSGVAVVGVLVLGGCPKGGQKSAALVGTKWEGYIDVADGCEHGGYTGGDLRVCVIFDDPASGSGLLFAHVDWDPSQLRDDCGYFSFVSRADTADLHLIRHDAGEQDTADVLRLRRQGDRLVGTLQVHPACNTWPVTLGLIPQPSTETKVPGALPL